MKSFLKHRSRRRGYDGWALRVKGESTPLPWTVCTTRQEVRDLQNSLEKDFFSQPMEIVKVKITAIAVTK